MDLSTGVRLFLTRIDFIAAGKPPIVSNSEEPFRVAAWHVGHNLDKVQTAEARQRPSFRILDSDAYLPLRDEDSTRPVPNLAVLTIQWTSQNRATSCTLGSFVDEQHIAECVIDSSDNTHTIFVPLGKTKSGSTLRLSPHGIPPDRTPPIVASSSLVHIPETGLPPRLTMNPDDPFAHTVATGFWRSELFPSGQYHRWTSASSIISFPLLKASTDVLLTLSIRGADPFPEGQSVRVRVNGDYVGKEEKALSWAEGFHKIAFTVPAPALKRGMNQLAIETTPWRPCDHSESSDNRELGVLLDWVEWTVLDQEMAK
jgi:hypothetical protein